MRLADGKIYRRELIMDVHSIGTPITASQRRTYRETPDSDFYQTFMAAYDAQASKAAADTSSASASDAGRATLESLLGYAHTSLSAMRGVSTESQQSYAAILDKAYSSGGVDNARQFLASLSPEELDTVRRNHCLADRIDTASLSEEGARNLLLPEGYRVDLNRDGIDEVGAARTMSFPPSGAPAEFREAWFQATANMDEGSMMTYGLSMHGAIYGLQLDEASTSGPQLPVDQMASYRTVVDRFLASLESFKGFLAEGQYERDKAFYTKLQTLLQA